MKWVTYIFLLCMITAAFGQNSDIEILRKINVTRNKNFDNSFIFITHTAAPVSISLPIILFGTGYFSKNTDLKIKGVTLFASIAISTAISTGLKYSINRTRPYNRYPEIEQVIPVSTASFPSGHTSIVFATATTISISFPKWYIIAPSLIWASSVAYSRMHLGEHYPTDVVAGAIIGSGSAYLMYVINKWMKTNYDKSKEKVL